MNSVLRSRQRTAESFDPASFIAKILAWGALPVHSCDAPRPANNKCMTSSPPELFTPRMSALVRLFEGAVVLCTVVRMCA